MKNKTSLLTITTAVLLSGCMFSNQDNTSTNWSKLKKPSIGGSNSSGGDTTSNYITSARDVLKLKNKNGKWEYQLKDDKGQTFSFVLDDLEVKNGFKETKTFTNFKVQNPNNPKDVLNADVKVKFPTTQTKLDYGHYGIMETTFAKGSGADYFKFTFNPFFASVAENKIIKNFERPSETLTFKGKTHAVLTTATEIAGQNLPNISYENLSGDATMKIDQNDRAAKLLLDYGDWQLGVKDWDFVNKSNNLTLAVNKDNLELDTDENNEIRGYMLGENNNYKEFVGTYKFHLKQKTGTTEYMFDGGFGMKKE